MLIRHPFDKLAPRDLATATVGLALAFILLTGILLYVVPPDDFLRIQELSRASSAGAGLAVLGDWPASTFQVFSFLLGFDFLYDLVHNNGVALFAIWGARRLSSHRVHPLASLTAWIMWLDTALNIFENLAFFSVIRTLEPEPLLPIALAVFDFRSATLIAGAVVGIALHGLGFWKSHRSAA